MFEVSVLIEAGAGGTQQDYVARIRVLARVGDGVLHVAGVDDRGRVAERFGDAFRGGADGDHASRFFADEIAHPFELTGFVFSAEDEPDAGRRKRFERFKRGIDVRSFRVVDPTNAVELADELQAMR